MKSYVMWSRTTIWSALCPWPSRCDAQDVHAGVGQGGREAGLCVVVQGVRCQHPLWSATHALSTVQPTSRLLTLYMPMQDTQALSRILDLADKANGYVFARLADQSPVPPEMMYGATVKVSRASQGAAVVFTGWLAGCAVCKCIAGGRRKAGKLQQRHHAWSWVLPAQGSETDIWMQYQERFLANIEERDVEEDDDD